MHTPWFLEMLGLTGEADERAIKRAYAARLKTIDPAVDPDDFARLREAFERAKAWATRRDTPSTATVHPDEGRIDTSGEHRGPEAAVAHVDEVFYGHIDEESPSPPLPTTPDAGERLATLATSLIDEPGTGTRVLLYRVTQDLRQQHLEARAAFEMALIDALREQRLVRRAELFMSASAEFDWHEVGHLDTLGAQRCAWVEHVLASEAAWKALPEARREQVMGWLAEADRQRNELPDRLLGAWPHVDAYMKQYGAWLGLSLRDEVRKAWITRYGMLPANRRKKLERAAERAMAPPGTWRRWLTVGWGWSWRRALLIFMVLRLLSAAFHAIANR